MTHKKIRYYTSNLIPLSLENLCGWKTTVVDIVDAIEDAETVGDLLVKFANMDLLEIVYFDKENEKKIRFKCVDRLGNVSYLEIMK